MTTEAKSIALDPATIGATLSPCEAAEKRASDDVTFGKLLEQARAAGTIYGASQGKGAASEFYAEVADEISGPALVLLGLRHQGDGELGAELLPTAEAAPVLMVELFGLVQESIKSAQRAAAKAMRNLGQGAKAKDAEASARKSITQGINRGLSGYGVKADFFACQLEAVGLAKTKTDAEKAAESVAAALKKDFFGALNGFADLDASQLAVAINRLNHYAAKVKAAAEAEQAKAAEAEAALQRLRDHKLEQEAEQEAARRRLAKEQAERAEIARFEAEQAAQATALAEQETEEARQVSAKAKAAKRDRAA